MNEQKLDRSVWQVAMGACAFFALLGISIRVPFISLIAVILGAWATINFFRAPKVERRRP